jgi:hypothetical protein
LVHSLFSFGGGASTTARVRYVGSGDTYLYTGIRHGSGSTEDLKVFNVSSPSKLAYKGGNLGPTWGGTGSRLIPQFWPDEWPDVIAVGVPPQGGTGNAEPGGVQIVELGPASAPLDDPVFHSWSTVTLGSISGGSVGFPTQKGNKFYWFATYGFVQVDRLVWGELTGNTMTSGGEVSWFGASELSGVNRRGYGPMDYVPTVQDLAGNPTSFVHSLSGSSYGLLFTDAPQLVTQNNPGTNNSMGGMFHFYNQPMFWRLKQRTGGSNTGVEILYVDVTSPILPTNDTWTINTDGELLGQNNQSGMAQATYDHDKMVILMKFGSIYKVLNLNFVTREILNEWTLPIPPPSTNPYGTFVTKNASYFGLWDSGGVYLLDLGIRPERKVASSLGNRERAYRK